MSKYDIYELMGEYTDEEFAPSIDNSINVKEVRKHVEERVEMPRRHIRLKTALVAAAVAAAAAICTGVAIATYNNHVTLTVDMLATKGVVVNYGYSDDGGSYRETDYRETEEISPLELREGRLWFVADGQDFDVTDMIDMETAYIYKTVNPDTGLADWIVVGGTPECYGFYEIMKYGPHRDEMCTCEKEFCMHCKQTVSYGEITTSIGTYTINGEDIPEYKMTEEECVEAWNMAKRGEARYTLRTALWMRNAREELGLSWQNSFESEDGTIMSFGMED